MIGFLICFQGTKYDTLGPTVPMPPDPICDIVDVQARDFSFAPCDVKIHSPRIAQITDNPGKLGMNFEKARFNMVEQQIRTWDVLDQQVLDIIASTARDEFVPEDYLGVSYSDTRIPIGHGETMMAPKVEGRILQALRIGPADRGLEVGTGSGFLTMLISQMAKHLITMDVHEEFTHGAAKRLAARNTSNVDFVTQDGCGGYPEGGPFDFIAVTGAMATENPALREQLAVGGRLFVIVGELPIMEALLIERQSETVFASEALFETELKYLLGAEAPAKFSFE